MWLLTLSPLSLHIITLSEWLPLANTSKIRGISHALLVHVYQSAPGAQLTYFNDGGGGGGGGPKDFFGSDILAKRDFFGSMKDARIFWGRKNNTGIFLGIVFFIS